MIEQSFIESGFSFTTAKLLPYIITILIGLILMFLVKRKMNLKNRVLKGVMLFFVLIAPFGIYFILNPIFDGDFSNNYEIVERSEKSEDLSGDKLYVISIANCPYCKDAMEKMLVLEKRNPQLEVEYLVCSLDTTSLVFYREINEGKIPVNLAKHPEELMVIAGGSFPAFVLSQKDSPLKKWSNQDFGVRALDEIETILKN